jgi:LytS/YehU family sensor histidine kinase
LNSIQYFINKNDKTHADHYLVGLSKLLRHSLNNSEKELIPLSEELHMLDNYISLEQMRFYFHYEKSVDPKLETENLPVPPMLLQPLIENAIRHGISAMGTNGTLRIKAVKENNDLVISISDNGPGIDSSKALKGIGIQMVKSRIKILTRQRYNIDLAFQNGNPGATVTVRFKNWI